MENKAALPVGPRSTPAARAKLSRSRAKLLDVLRAQTAPTSIAALAAHTGLHENTLRGHLDGLSEVGLVSRRRATPDGRGRPGWLWSARETTETSEYAGLAAALALTLQHASADPGAAASEAGRAWGHTLARERATAATDQARPREKTLTLMTELGFEPQAAGHPGGSGPEEVRLTQCPLLEVARKHTEIVCNVHAGLVRGALAEYGDDDTEVTLLPFAEPGACLLGLRTPQT